MGIEFENTITIQGEETTGGGTTINNQDKVIYANGVYSADSGYTGLGNVDVKVYATSGLITMFNPMETEVSVTTV